MPDATSHTFEVIAVRRGEELTRVTVVAANADAALEEGRWLLAEEAKVNLFDFEISFLIETDGPFDCRTHQVSV